MQENKHSLRTFLVIALLVAATAGVYAQVYRHDFLNYDDPGYVSDNARVQAGLTRNGVIWAFTSRQESNWHPLTWLSLMLDTELLGPTPAGYHVTNVILHILNTILLLLLLERMTGAFWRSAFVAALFALHPLHVESVAWISERKDVLSTLFWLLTLWAYTNYGRKPRGTGYLLAVVFFALGLLAKPMLVTLPFVLLLLDFWPLQRMRSHHGDITAGAANIPEESPQPRHSLRYLIVEKIPFLVLTAASCVITYVVQQSEGAVKTVEEFSRPIRVGNACTAYVSYIGKMLWPQNLVLFYPHPGNHLSVTNAVICGLIVLSITAGVLLAARRYGWALTGWFWYVGTLIPVIGLVQVGVQAMADRYTYVPLIGLFVMISWGSAEVCKHISFLPRKILWLPGLSILGLLAITTWFQVGYWRNDRVAYQHAYDRTKNNYIASCNLGLLLAQEGKSDEAAIRFREALKFYPNYPKAQYNLAKVLAEMGRTDEAIQAYETALKMDPTDVSTYNNLGLLLAQKGETGRAIEIYRRGQKVNPRTANLAANLGVALYASGKPEEAIAALRQSLQIQAQPEVYYNLGTLLLQQGQVDEAIAAFESALKLDKNGVKAHYGLGNALMAQGRLEEAAGHYQQTVLIEPSHLNARINLGVCLAQAGRLGEAAEQFRAALRLDPANINLYLNLARALYFQDKGEEALSELQHALQVAPGNANVHCAMGDFLQQMGRTAEAVKAYEKALQIDPNHAQAKAGLQAAQSHGADTK